MFSGDDGLLSVGNPFRELTELADDGIPGYVRPSAVAVVLLTKAIFGFAHCGGASGLLGRPHERAPQRRNSALPTSQTDHLLMSAQPVGFAV